MGEAVTPQVEYGLQLEADWGVRDSTEKRNIPNFQVARRHVLVIRRDESNAVRKIQSRSWPANLKNRVRAAGFICWISLKDDNCSTTSGHREQFCIPAGCKCDIMGIVESRPRSVDAPIGRVFE